MSEQPSNPFDTIEEAIAAIAAGEPVIVTDDEARENEGDLIVAGQKATPEIINLMIREARGLVCVPMTAPQLQRLGIHSMVANNRESHGTNFTVSVDAAEGITTGIGAYDRYKVVSILSDPEATPDQLVQPGHIFPLGARPGGVLQRAGHTEAAVDLVTLAGLFPVGVICEILKEDGSSARLPDLVEFKKKHGLKLVSISDLIHYRHKREKLVKRVARLPFESEFGQFELHVFQSASDHRKHIALTRGELDERPTLVRVHSENILGDIFQGKQISGRSSLARALERVAQEDRGVVLYMEQPDGGVKLVPGSDGEPSLAPAKMDFRDYGIGAQILSELGLQKIRLLSSTERRVVALDGYGLEIVETVAL